MEGSRSRWHSVLVSLAPSYVLSHSFSSALALSLSQALSLFFIRLILSLSLYHILMTRESKELLGYDVARRRAPTHTKAKIDISKGFTFKNQPSALLLSTICVISLITRLMTQDNSIFSSSTWFTMYVVTCCAHLLSRSLSILLILPFLLTSALRNRPWEKSQ